MKLRLVTALLSLTACVWGSISISCQVSGPDRGEVLVHGNEIYRDGRPWIPHGFYQIAFEVAPANLGRADHPFWANAQQHYKPAEYRDMYAAGADSVRLQISQGAADPYSPLFDRLFLNKAMEAVRAARSAGLTVIISVQDESHVPGDHPIDLPDDGTRRVWQLIAPTFAQDRGVLFELLNEPRLQPSASNWKRWAQSMTQTIRTVRQAGARNVVIVDGLDVGQVIDGAPILEDPQVAYASHPYALHSQGQTRKVWDSKFGNFSRKAPVIITEWGSGGYYCDGNTANATVDFLGYLQEHKIGLEVGTWDWGPGGFGSARYGFPAGVFSTFDGRSCHQPGFGLGKTVESWYKNGYPPASPQ